MTFDPMDDQRRRDAEQRVREAEQREREKERADREREHEQRREERRARHEARHEFGFRHRGLDINVDVDPDEIARSVSAAFIGMDSGDDTETHDQTIEKMFTVDGMPRLRVQNVSGEIAIRVGESGQVRVVAHKRVKGGSADRAKRLLENVEIRIEQERSWLDLFRGKRFRVDFEITVPRETAVNAQTVSGDLDLNGTRGPARVESVSGDVNIADVQGPMRLKSVSGDVQCTDYVGSIEGSSVSGDVDIRGRVRACELHTVSGDISVDLDPEAGGREGRKDRTIIIGDGRSHLTVKTVSGDLTIKPASSSVHEEHAAAHDSGAAEADVESETESDRDPERTAPMAP